MTDNRFCGDCSPVFLIILLLLSGCAGTGSQNRVPTGANGPELRNTFLLPVQEVPPPEIQTVQLHQKNRPGSPPLLRLGSDDRLVLEFDFLGEQSRQFKVRVTHRTKNWRESTIGPNIYLDSFFETYFGGGKDSYTGRPTYRHYQYEFPNSRMSIVVSGNYLLEIYDYNTGDLLFSVPFFVSEQKGNLNTEIRELFARRQDLRVQHQPVSDFSYPGFVEMPRFDLSFFYIQNRFWGRAKEVELFDTSTPGRVHFYLGRDRAFLGDYEFNVLDLRELEPDGQQILEVQQGLTPPKVILRRDIQNLSPAPRFTLDSRFGRPIDTRNAYYADVQFSLDAADLDPQARVYVVGDFNNWGIDVDNRMHYDMKTGLWKGRALVKQGEYAYKYIRLTQNRVNDLALDRSFTSGSQEYITMVYFRDPSRHFDRLINVGRVHR